MKPVKYKRYIITISLITIFAACTGTKNIQQTSLQPNHININGKLFATLFQQRAAEYRALCYQAYNAGRMQVLNYKAPDNKPLAIVTDVDETILDNSPYAAYRGLQGMDYEPASWYDWTDMASADTMPGAGSFLRFVNEKNIEIFYLTNREERERGSTLTNLQKMGLPNADASHLLTRVTTSSKEQRRIDVARQYNIVLFMGDNLADFSVLFEKKNTEERAAAADKLSAEFGHRFIVFPNTTYGDWESATYDYRYNYSVPQKDSVIKSRVKAY